MPGRLSFLVSAAMPTQAPEPEGPGVGADAVRPPTSPRRELLEWCAGILIILALVLTGFALPYTASMELDPCLSLAGSALGRGGLPKSSPPYGSRRVARVDVKVGWYYM